MNSMIKTLLGCAFIGMAGKLTAAPVLFPNGTFTDGGTSWQEVGPSTFAYPDSGGNPDGYGVIDATTAAWGIWVGAGDAAIPLDSLGLKAGRTHVFFQDMKILSGANVGGFKIDFVPSGTTGDIRVARSGDGRSWAKYEYPVVIPAGATGIKVVPLWGEKSRVAFDNIGVETTPVVPVVVAPDLVFEDDFAVAGTNWSGPTGGAGLTRSLEWSGSAGNPGGATVLTAANPAGAPAAVSFTYTAADVDFGDGPVEISFDGKLLNLKPGTAIHVRYNGNFVGAIMNEMNDVAYTTVKRVFSLGQGFRTTTSFKLSFEFALGAVVNSGGSLAVDNIRVMTRLPGVPPPPAVTIQAGTLVSWPEGGATSLYQPQESQDDTVWVNLGTPIASSTVTTSFDASRSPFYRVLQTTSPVFDNAVLNPGFETSDVSSNPADDWKIPIQANQGASMTVGDAYGAMRPHRGSKMLILESTGPGAPAPNVEVRSVELGITGGTPYTLSFWVANPVKVAGANPQYSLFYFDETGGLISNSFTPGIGSIGADWTLFSAAVTPPVNAVKMTIGWIQAASAEPNVHWVTLIDDVSLSEGTLMEAGTSVTVAASAAPAVRISWPGVVGRQYQVRASAGLRGWVDFGGLATGAGEVMSTTDLMTPAAQFYRVDDITP